MKNYTIEIRWNSGQDQQFTDIHFRDRTTVSVISDLDLIELEELRETETRADEFIYLQDQWGA